MKRIIICGLIVIALIILGAASFYYTDTVTDDSARALDDISRSFDDGDLSGALSLTSQLSKTWQSYARNDIFIIDKEHVAEITSSLLRIKALAAEEDPELTTECKVAKELIILYREKNGLNLKNIF